LDADTNIKHMHEKIEQGTLSNRSGMHYLTYLWQL